MKCNLMFQIETKRQEMIDSALKEGFNTEATIKLSKELDLLMNIFNNCSITCKINQKDKNNIHTLKKRA